MENMWKKGGLVSTETPQGGKVKTPPQVPPQDPQDDPKDAIAWTLTDVATYAAAMLGLLSGNKDQEVTTVTMPESKDNGDKKMPAVYTPPKLKDPPDQQGTLNMAPNQNITVHILPTQSNAAHDGLAHNGCPKVLEKGLLFLWHSLIFSS